jgi:hypothetical protein
VDITQPKIAKFIRWQFKRADKDGNGSISLSEYLVGSGVPVCIAKFHEDTCRQQTQKDAAAAAATAAVLASDAAATASSDAAGVVAEEVRKTKAIVTQIQKRFRGRQLRKLVHALVAMEAEFGEARREELSAERAKRREMLQMKLVMRRSVRVRKKEKVGIATTVRKAVQQDHQRKHEHGTGDDGPCDDVVAGMSITVEQKRKLAKALDTLQRGIHLKNKAPLTGEAAALKVAIIIQTRFRAKRGRGDVNKLKDHYLADQARLSRSIKLKMDKSEALRLRRLEERKRKAAMSERQATISLYT